MKRIDRLVGIALLLSARRRLRAEELARDFAVSVRTIYRDVRALEEAGFPVVGSAGDGYRLPPGSHLRPLNLDPSEAEALLIGARLLERSADEALQDRLRGAVAKLEAVLPPEVVRRLGESRASVIMPPFRSRRPGPLTLLLEAIKDRKVVEVLYQGLARGEATRRAIEPLGLVRLGETWLVPCYCRLREDLRTFRADLMLEARLTGETFAPRSGLGLEDVIRLEEKHSPRSS
ncbi:MAG TPA: WYL domain-containing protein [Vicinamibacteria bacterium]|nr:WYL domain-containing protein [Vicinamibacteria bacterium]